MNVKNLLKSFKQFTGIENGAIIKIQKKRQKENEEAVSEKGEVKLKNQGGGKIIKYVCQSLLTQKMRTLLNRRSLLSQKLP